MTAPQDPAEILRNSKVFVSVETFAFVSVSSAGLDSLLQKPEYSPRMMSPFMILKDAHEVTLVLDEIDLFNMGPGLVDARIIDGYRMLTFEVEMEHSVVGFMAEVSRILAAALVPIMPVAAFSRDHIFIRQEHLAAALKALGPHVSELC